MCGDDECLNKRNDAAEDVATTMEGRGKRMNKTDLALEEALLYGHMAEF